jgi:hypothetical protein
VSDTDEPPPPRLRVVAENDAATARVNRDEVFARQDVEQALRVLAANLMRVSRGAGRPYMLFRDCLEVVKTAQAYHDATGSWPSDYVISNAITCEEYREVENPSDYWRGRKAALDTIVKGALQLAASRQLVQIPQERAGEHELIGGFQRLQEVQQAENRLWKERLAAARNPRPKKRVSGRVKRRTRPADKVEL